MVKTSCKHQYISGGHVQPDKEDDTGNQPLREPVRPRFDERMDKQNRQGAQNAEKSGGQQTDIWILAEAECMGVIPEDRSTEKMVSLTGDPFAESCRQDRDRKKNHKCDAFTDGMSLHEGIYSKCQHDP